MKNKKNNNKTKNIYVTMGISILTILLIVVTYAFKNYVKNNDMYNVTPTKIRYSIEPSDLVTLTNVFPISSDELVEDLSNHATVTVNIKGGTTSNNGVEYIVKLDQVDNMVNEKVVPITYNAAASNLGEITEDYLNSRDLDKNLYQLNEIGTVYSNETVVIGYIKKGETSFNGSVTLTAFVDADRIGIYDGEGEIKSDDYSESGAIIPDYYYRRDDENIVVFTPSEWEEINDRGMSFKVRVELKEGIWITND